ncbi:MAG: molybdenum ABC transporter ATP-binding protein [Methylobacteriaceae bacterium]|nr:molybdenum ABC transporter ATP-binding protein [Methylobacteriaceae bacterium]MBV9633238.1 molybdenum ABC transporter ATP-binding protein [Methylobacteriaceae bacterium]
MSILVEVALARGDFTLDVSIATENRVIALFGPSGAGKTSILDIVAGLSRAARGRVVIDGAVLQDTASGIFVPPHRRGIGYVFQEGRLFPHLSVRRNLLYGAWLRRRQRQLATLDEVTDLLAIGHLVGRDVKRLSGGEKQRVAIGRALLSAPRMLLLDEPLAALDDARKKETLPYIERLRDAFALPMIYVSHNRAEVERIATEIVHVAKGRIVRPPTK